MIVIGRIITMIYKLLYSYEIKITKISLIHFVTHTFHRQQYLNCRLVSCIKMTADASQIPQAILRYQHCLNQRRGHIEQIPIKNRVELDRNGYCVRLVISDKTRTKFGVDNPLKTTCSRRKHITSSPSPSLKNLHM